MADWIGFWNKNCWHHLNFFLINYFVLISCHYHIMQLINWVQAVKNHMTLLPTSYPYTFLITIIVADRD